MNNRRLRWILLASALLGLAPAPARAGTLKFWSDWETASGRAGLTAVFSTGTGKQATIHFDADTAEGGGLYGIVTGITIRPTGSVDFIDFECLFPGCNQNDYLFVPGTATDNARVVVDDTADIEDKHGVWDVGVVTFDADQEPGTIELTGCAYTTGSPPDLTERSCTAFTLVTLPEPGTFAALLAGSVMLSVATRARARNER